MEFFFHRHSPSHPRVPPNRVPPSSRPRPPSPPPPAPVPAPPPSSSRGTATAGAPPPPRGRRQQPPPQQPPPQQQTQQQAPRVISQPLILFGTDLHQVALDNARRMEPTLIPLSLKPPERYQQILMLVISTPIQSSASSISTTMDMVTMTHVPTFVKRQGTVGVEMTMHDADPLIPVNSYIDEDDTVFIHPTFDPNTHEFELPVFLVAKTGVSIPASCVSEAWVGRMLRKYSRRNRPDGERYFRWMPELWNFKFYARGVEGGYELMDTTASAEEEEGGAGEGWRGAAAVEQQEEVELGRGRRRRKRSRRAN